MLTGEVLQPSLWVYWLVWLGVALVAVYFTLRGLRWVWFAVIGVTAFFALVYLMRSHPFYVLWELIYIALLLAPPSRRHFDPQSGP